MPEVGPKTSLAGARTWRVSRSELPQMQECQLVELASGALLMNMRTAHVNASCKCRAVSRSEDGGRECTRHLSIGFAFALHFSASRRRFRFLMALSGYPLAFAVACRDMERAMVRRGAD